MKLSFRTPQKMRKKTGKLIYWSQLRLLKLSELWGKSEIEH